MKKFSLLSITLLISVIGFSQAPILNWVKTYHGNEYSFDSSSVMKMYNTDNSIYIGATSDAFGTANDMLLIKRDYLTGDTLWTKRYNGTANGDDQFVDMVINQNTGDVYITGKSQGIGTGYDFVTIKYSKTGSVVWSKRWDNNKSHGDDYPSAIGLDADGNIYLAGTTYNGNYRSFTLPTNRDYDVILFRYSQTGTLFSSFYPYSNHDDELGCLLTHNVSSYYLDKTYMSKDNALFMKISNNGTIFYAGNTTTLEIPYGFYSCVQMNTITDMYNPALNSDNTSDGNNGWKFKDAMIFGDEINALELDNSNNAYLLFTTINTTQKQKSLMVYKLNKEGQYYYYNSIIKDDSQKDFNVTKIKVDASGNLYVVGYEENAQNNLDWFIVKLDSAGKLKWKVNKTGNDNGDDKATDISLDNMQNPVIVGTTQNSSGKDEITFIKIDKNSGSEIFTQTYKKDNWNSKAFNLNVDGKNNILINGIQTADFKANTLTLKYSEPVGNAGIISGKTTVCQSETNVVYTVPEIPNATTYEWILPNGFTGISSTNSIAVNIGKESLSGIISVKGKSSFGEGNSSEINVTVAPKPNVSAGTDATICDGNSISLTATGANTYTWNNDVKQGVSFVPTQTKDYIVNGSNGLCTYTDTIKVTVVPVSSSPSIYISDGVLYSTSPTGNQWYLNGVIIENASNSNYTPITSGNYNAAISNGTCFSALSNAVSFIKTGLNEIGASNNLVVYPNPTTGLIEISTQEVSGNGFTIEVYNDLGKRIRSISKSTDGKKCQIDLSNYKSGIYLIQITTQDKTYQSKIVKQ